MPEEQRQTERAGYEQEKRLRPYPPMPPLVGTQAIDGGVEPTIAVGLLP